MDYNRDEFFMYCVRFAGNYEDVEWVEDEDFVMATFKGRGRELSVKLNNGFDNPYILIEDGEKVEVTRDLNRIDLFVSNLREVSHDRER